MKRRGNRIHGQPSPVDPSARLRFRTALSWGLSPFGDLEHAKVYGCRMVLSMPRSGCILIVTSAKTPFVAVMHVMESYDPTWALELAREQFPGDSRLHQALAACTRVHHYCSCGCGTPYFVDLSEEEAGEASEFGMRIVLRRPDGSPVAVDLLPDGRVACIEGR